MSPGAQLTARNGDGRGASPEGAGRGEAPQPGRQGSIAAIAAVFASEGGAAGVTLKPHRGSPPHQPQRDSHDPERFAHAVARVFLEVEVGRRPLHQLSPVLAPALQARLAVVARRPGPGPTLDAVVAVRSSRPHPDACDAAVVVRRGERVGVIVVRLERHRAAWRVVELARPEDRTPSERRSAGATREEPS